MDLKQQLKEKNKQIDDLFLSLKNHSFEENVFTGVAFVAFNTVKETEQYCKLFPDSIIEYLLVYLKSIYYTVNVFEQSANKIDHMKKTIFRVINASEPSDIIWENLEYSLFNRIQRYIITYLSTFVLIGAGFGIIFALNLAQSNANSGSSLSTGLSIIISLVISVINFIIQMLLEFLTK